MVKAQATMPGTMRIAVLNDYSISTALKLIAEGSYPAQHSWGASLFKSMGAQAVVFPFHGATLSASLRTQMAVLLQQHRFDVVYSACQSETWLLSRLRTLGLFRKPIVAVIHHPVSGRLRGGERFVRGHDSLLFLSRLACEHARAAWPGLKDRMETVDWGVDLAFYDQQPVWDHGFGRNYFVSAGKANRDHQLLADCAAQGRHRTVIVCSEQTKPHQADASCVTVVSDRSGHALSYGQLTSVYRDARAIVIPMQHVQGLAGLTSLLDAMACGKPVIMTRNASVDIDIEALGFGIWIDAQDARSLRQAMDRLATDDALVHQMGAKAREFAQTAYRYDAFARTIVSRCQAVCRATQAPSP